MTDSTRLVTNSQRIAPTRTESVLKVRFVQYGRHRRLTIDWYYRTISVQLGEKAVRMFSIYVLKIPIPKNIVKIDNEDAIYKIYGLTVQEVYFLKTRGH